MLTLGCDTFGLSLLVLPKQTIATYCAVRLEADTLALVLRASETAASTPHLAPLACNLPLLLSLPLQNGASSRTQVIQSAFTRRKLPRQGALERLATLARLEEERFGTYLAPLVTRLRADVDRKVREVADLIAHGLLTRGFPAIAEALLQLAKDSVSLISDQGPLALLSAQLEARLTMQLRELERIKQQVRTPLRRVLPPLRARHHARAVRLTQEMTITKLTMRLCQMLWHEERLLPDVVAWLETQRARLQSTQQGLQQRVQALARQQQEIAAHDNMLERAGRGLSLPDALREHGQSLEDLYRRAGLSPAMLAQEVAMRVATEEPEATLAFLQHEAMQQSWRAVAPLSLLGIVGQLDAAVRRQLLSRCVQAADVQLRIDAAVYVARTLRPAMTHICIVPGGAESVLATWLQEVVAEPWDFVHRDSDEEIVFLTTGHRILPEALIGPRLLYEVYERFPRKEWVQILSQVGDMCAVEAHSG
jgi:hypothetical protein